MPTENTTPNQGYQLPFAGNNLSDDVARVISAISAIDTDVASALSALAAKAGLASPAFTGTPTAPTPAPGTDTAQLATTAFLKAALDVIDGGAPGDLNTFNKLAAALGDDADYAASMVTALALKADKSSVVPIDAAVSLSPEQITQFQANIAAMFSDKATAEAGTDNTKAMTSLRTKEAFDVFAPAYNRWKTIQLTDFSASSLVSMTDLANYQFLRALLEIRSDATEAAIKFRASTDNGSTWIAGTAYNFMYGHDLSPSTAAASFISSNDGIGLHNGNTISASVSTIADLSLVGFNKAVMTAYQLNGAGDISAGASFMASRVQGYINNTTAKNALAMIATQPVSGTIHLEGIAT